MNHPVRLQELAREFGACRLVSQIMVRGVDLSKRQTISHSAALKWHWRLQLGCGIRRLRP